MPQRVGTCSRPAQAPSTPETSAADGDTLQQGGRQQRRSDPNTAAAGSQGGGSAGQVRAVWRWRLASRFPGEHAMCPAGAGSASWGKCTHQRGHSTALPRMFIPREAFGFAGQPTPTAGEVLDGCRAAHGSARAAPVLVETETQSRRALGPELETQPQLFGGVWGAVSEGAGCGLRCLCMSELREPRGIAWCVPGKQEGDLGAWESCCAGGGCCSWAEGELHLCPVPWAVWAVLRTGCTGAGHAPVTHVPLSGCRRAEQPRRACQGCPVWAGGESLPAAAAQRCLARASCWDTRGETPDSRHCQAEAGARAGGSGGAGSRTRLPSTDRRAGGGGTLPGDRDAGGPRPPGRQHERSQLLPKRLTPQ